MRNNTNPDILYLKSEEGIQEIFILEDATSGYFPFACPSENIQLSGGLSNAHTISFFFFLVNVLHLIHFYLTMFIRIS